MTTDGLIAALGSVPLEIENAGQTKTTITTDDICTCNCHSDGSLHFEACCAGPCEVCGQHIVFGQVTHHRQRCQPR